MPLPLTNTRLASSLSIAATHQTSDSGIPINPSDLLNAATSLAEFVSSFKVIGGTHIYRVNQAGSNYLRRGINSPREPFAAVPGQIATTIEMERAVLYFEDAMAGFNFLPGNIAFQTRPLMIFENLTTPTSDQTNPSASDVEAFARQGLESVTDLANAVQASPLIYLNCWIRESRINYDIKGTDQAVLQSLVVDVGRIVQPSALIPGVGEPASQILAQSVPILSAIRRL